VAEALAGVAAVVSINTQENPGLARRFGVRGIPVIHLLSRGADRGQFAGAQSPDAILTWFRQQGP